MLSAVRDHIFNKFSKQFWKYRNLFDKNWVNGYLSDEALNHPHRKMLLDTLEKYYPFETLLEIGCGPGPNLINIHRKWPEVALCGQDVSRTALESVRRNLPGKFEEIVAEPWLFDIVLTDAFLIYVSPKRFMDMSWRAIKALVMCEWHSDDGPFVDHGHFVHDYRKYFPTAKITKIPENVWAGGGWGEHGHIIEVDMRKK